MASTIESIAEQFYTLLTQLTVNSRRVIENLTKFALDNIEHARIIVIASEVYLSTAESHRILLVLYAIDSMMKSSSCGTYSTLFGKNLHRTFASVYPKTDEITRQKLLRMRQTWSDILPSNDLYSLDIAVNSCDPNWPIVPLITSESIIRQQMELLEMEQCIAEMKAKIRQQQQLIDKRTVGDDKNKVVTTKMAIVAPVRAEPMKTMEKNVESSRNKRENDISDNDDSMLSKKMKTDSINQQQMGWYQREQYQYNNNQSNFPSINRYQGQPEPQQQQQHYWQPVVCTRPTRPLQNRSAFNNARMNPIRQSTNGNTYNCYQTVQNYRSSANEVQQRRPMMMNPRQNFPIPSVKSYFTGDVSAEKKKTELLKPDISVPSFDNVKSIVGVKNYAAVNNEIYIGKQINYCDNKSDEELSWFCSKDDWVNFGIA